jgi:hypothetical protein
VVLTSGFYGVDPSLLTVSIIKLNRYQFFSQTFRVRRDRLREGEIRTQSQTQAKKPGDRHEFGCCWPSWGSNGTLGLHLIGGDNDSMGWMALMA